MIHSDGYDPNDPRDSPAPRTEEDHAVAITEAIERLLTATARTIARDRAALAEAIRAAIDSVRAPAWVPADNAAYQAAHVGQREARDFGALQERAAIVAWLREHAVLDPFEKADRIERGEHLSAACTCPARTWGDANATIPGPHHAPACPLHRRGAP